MIYYNRVYKTKWEGKLLFFKDIFKAKPNINLFLYELTSMTNLHFKEEYTKEWHMQYACPCNLQRTSFISFTKRVFFILFPLKFASEIRKITYWLRLMTNHFLRFPQRILFSDYNSQKCIFIASHHNTALALVPDLIASKFSWKYMSAMDLENSFYI